MHSMSIDYEVIISTCEKFSDLWDAHVLLMERNWKAHGKAYLVTDAPADRRYAGVEVVCAGADTEITQRLRFALERVTSQYILFTLDDYFLTEPIDQEALQRTLAVMEAEKLDYIWLDSPTNPYMPNRQELRREGAVELKDHPGYYLRNMAEGNYKISLYPGLWRTDFMRQTLEETRNAWQYEVALTEMAHRLGARCGVSHHGEFPFLDVIRKGKVLRKAHRYFQQNPIYRSQREVMGFWDEWKLSFRMWLKRALPKTAFILLKKLMIKCGMTFYSPVK